MKVPPLASNILKNAVTSRPRLRYGCFICAAIILAATSCAVAQDKEKYTILNSKMPVTQEMSRLFADIIDSEYNIEWRASPGVCETVNRQQNLRFTFEPTGFAVRPLDASGPNGKWQIGLRLKAFGVEEPVEAPTEPRFVVDHHTAQLAVGAVRFEYTNSAAGMRQTVVIDRKPNHGNLRLDFALKLDGVKLQAEPNAARFVTIATGQQVLSYRDLHVWDARGRQLTASMHGTPEQDRLTIEVDDSDAKYPVVVDPIVECPIFNGFHSYDAFGFSVAYTGANLNANNTNGGVVIGVPWYVGQGKVLVYRGLANGGYDPTPYWTAQSDGYGSQFGYSVAVAYKGITPNSVQKFSDGDGFDIAVGAPYYSSSGFNQNGAVFAWYGGWGPLYGGTPGTPANANWAGYGEQDNSGYGFSVASAGVLHVGTPIGVGNQSLVVGAPFFSQPSASGYPGATEGGRVYVYFGAHYGLGSQDWNYFGYPAFITIDFPWGGDYDTVPDYTHFGWSVSTAGDPYVSPQSQSQGFDAFIVGAPNFGGTGAAFMYQPGSGMYYGNPSASAMTGSQQGEQIGTSVSAAYNFFGTGTWDLFVGAPGHTDQNNVAGGAVYALRGPAAYAGNLGPATLLMLPPGQNQAGAQFGAAVAGLSFDGFNNPTDNVDRDGDEVGVLAVGAPYYTPTVNSQAQSHAGAAFVYTSPTATPLEADGQFTNAHFAASLAEARLLPGLHARGFVAGAPRYIPNGPPALGSAGVINATTISLQPIVTNTVEGSGNPAFFTITRSMTDLNAPLTVYFQLTGTATDGVDYMPLGQQITIQPPDTSTNVIIQALSDYLTEGTETVTLTITGCSENYLISGSKTATASITDGPPPPIPTVWVQAADPDATESDGHPGSFAVWRTPATLAAPLTVNFVISGTATEGSDYQSLVPHQVTIPGNGSAGIVTVRPILNPPDGDETVILTLTNGANYNIGTPSNATVTIHDGPTGDTTGTNFWLVFPSVFNLSSSPWRLMISSKTTTSANISIQGTTPSFSTNFTVTPGIVTNIEIPADAMISHTATNSVQNKGIHVTSSNAISVYALDYLSAGAEAFLGYPVPMLGTNYLVTARQASDNGSGQEYFARSEFAIVASQTNTTVTIFPSASAILGGHSSTNSFNVTLHQGQTYELQSTNTDGDVTGTLISSTKPIGIVAGASLAFVPGPSDPGNPLMEQQLALTNWITWALALPLADRFNGDVMRVLAAYSNTVVTVNGTVVATLQKNQVIEFGIASAMDIRASQPVQVSQFSTSQSTGGSPGDPFEMFLIGPQQYLTNYTVSCPVGGSANQFSEHFLALFVDSSAVSTTFLDGQPVSSLVSFTPIGTSGYSGAHIKETSPGDHVLTGSKPFGLQVYGLGGPDSLTQDGYGYVGGIRASGNGH